MSFMPPIHSAQHQGFLAARLAGANLVYHEHDSPAPGALQPWLARLRAAAVRAARLVVFPNEERARIANAELGFAPRRLRIVWNLPRRAELPQLLPIPEPPLIVYYHGSITPDRLPESVVEAVQRYHGRVRLRIAGYEAPGAPGYIARLVALARTAEGEPLVDYVGRIPRRERPSGTSRSRSCRTRADAAGNSGDVNMRNMTGASNKPFDYMAAGLALLVSDLPDWRDNVRGSRLCTAPAIPPIRIRSAPRCVGFSIIRRSGAQWPGAVAQRSRSDWSYDTLFLPVLATLKVDL